MVRYFNEFMSEGFCVWYKFEFWLYLKFVELIFVNAIYSEIEKNLEPSNRPDPLKFIQVSHVILKINAISIKKFNLNLVQSTNLSYSALLQKTQL